MAIAAAISLAAMSGASAQEPDSAEAAQAEQSEQDPPAEEAPPEEELSEEDLQIVCRTERVTGSLTRRRRTCLTRAEWAELERNYGQSHSDMTRNASGANVCRMEGVNGC